MDLQSSDLRPRSRFIPMQSSSQREIFESPLRNLLWLHGYSFKHSSVAYYDQKHAPQDFPTTPPSKLRILERYFWVRGHINGSPGFRYPAPYIFKFPIQSWRCSQLFIIKCSGGCIYITSRIGIFWNVNAITRTFKIVKNFGAAIWELHVFSSFCILFDGSYLERLLVNGNLTL